MPYQTPQPEVSTITMHSISLPGVAGDVSLDYDGSSNEPGGVLQPHPSRVIGSTVHLLTPACFLAAGSMALSTPTAREMLLLQVESVYGSRQVSTQSSGGRAARAAANTQPVLIVQALARNARNGLRPLPRISWGVAYARHSLPLSSTGGPPPRALI